MWEQFKHWVYHLFNPHCLECARDKECSNCDLLRQLLADERRNNEQLMNFMTPDVKEKKIEQIDTSAYIPRPKSWRVMRQTLEEQSRAEAQARKRHEEETKKYTQDLEDELKETANAD